MSSAILSPDAARDLSLCLMDACDLIPGISDQARLLLLTAAGVLAEHSCSAVIAQAETDQLLVRTNRLESAPVEVAATCAASRDRSVWSFLSRLVGRVPMR